MDEIKLTYVEPAEYFPKEIRDKYFKDIEDEDESSQKKTEEDIKEQLETITTGKKRDV